MNIKIKRVYERPDKEDGRRVLVDRLWPRGLSKEKAEVDEWMKDIAPSDELRKWFAHREDRWATFRNRYLEELQRNRPQLERLLGMCERGTVTLVFAARNEQYNNARVIREWLERNSPS
jgi:uncharacterized protein YeaO (DUF488 family)